MQSCDFVLSRRSLSILLLVYFLGPHNDVGEESCSDACVEVGAAPNPLPFFAPKVNCFIVICLLAVCERTEIKPFFAMNLWIQVRCGTLHDGLSLGYLPAVRRSEAF